MGRRLNKPLLEVMRKLHRAPGFAETGLTVVDSPEARVLGLTTASPPCAPVHPDTKPPCAHEDVVHECPFCAGCVDSDTHVCPKCREAVAMIVRCVTCDAEVA